MAMRLSVGCTKLVADSANLVTDEVRGVAVQLRKFFVRGMPDLLQDDVLLLGHGVP